MQNNYRRIKEMLMNYNMPHQDTSTPTHATTHIHIYTKTRKK